MFFQQIPFDIVIYTLNAFITINSMKNIRTLEGKDY